MAESVGVDQRTGTQAPSGLEAALGGKGPDQTVVLQGEDLKKWREWLATQGVQTPAESGAARSPKPEPKAEPQPVDSKPEPKAEPGRVSETEIPQRDQGVGFDTVNMSGDEARAFKQRIAEEEAKKNNPQPEPQAPTPEPAASAEAEPPVRIVDLSDLLKSLPLEEVNRIVNFLIHERGLLFGMPSHEVAPFLATRIQKAEKIVANIRSGQPLGNNGYFGDSRLSAPLVIDAADLSDMNTSKTNEDEQANSLIFMLTLSVLKKMGVYGGNLANNINPSLSRQILDAQGVKQGLLLVSTLDGNLIDANKQRWQLVFTRYTPDDSQIRPLIGLNYYRV